MKTFETVGNPHRTLFFFFSAASLAAMLPSFRAFLRLLLRFSSASCFAATWRSALRVSDLWPFLVLPFSAYQATTAQFALYDVAVRRLQHAQGGLAQDRRHEGCRTPKWTRTARRGSGAGAGAAQARQGQGARTKARRGGAPATAPNARGRRPRAYRRDERAVSATALPDPTAPGAPFKVVNISNLLLVLLPYS